jgi:hypothetical protein
MCSADASTWDPTVVLGTDVGWRSHYTSLRLQYDLLGEGRVQ